MQVAQIRVVAVAVAVAGRDPPEVLAGVEVDGRHARVGRLVQWQAPRHARRLDGAAQGEALVLRGAVGVSDGGAEGRGPFVAGVALVAGGRVIS